jgi:broad specificity phosphatase PhoE
MRNCESLEDTDKTAYERIADEDMPLTECGKKQAASFGVKFAQDLGSSKKIHFILSPSKRVLETARAIVENLPSHIKWSLFTDDLIAKQNWGNVTIYNRSEIEKERYRVGVLRYCFPGGESGAEMLFRFDLFVKKLSREMFDPLTENIMIITHGFEMRVILKSLLNWSEEYFETLAHPQHCELKRVAYNNGEFILLDEMRTHDLSANPNFVHRKSN